MDIPDLTSLTLAGFFGLLVLVMFFDVATASVIAIINGTFKTEFILAYLQSHVLKRVYLIFSLEVIGHGISFIGIPAIGAAADAAVASLALYVVETLGSLKNNLTDGSSAP